MKTTHILGISSVVLAIGLAAFATRDKGETEPPAAGDTLQGAKLSARGDRNQADADEASSPPRVGRRATPKPGTKSNAEEKLNELLTGPERVRLAEARLKYQEVENPPQERSGRDRAYAKLSEDIRTAIASNPDGWIETYESLRRDLEARHGGSPVRGGASPGSGLPEELPSAKPPSSPSSPTEELTPEYLKWAELQAERLIDFEKRSKPSNTTRDPRFKRPTQ